MGKVDVIYKGKVIGSEDIYLNEELKYYHPVVYGIMILSFVAMISSLVSIKKQKRKKRKKKKK